jgi:hypothetical protein
VTENESSLSNGEIPAPSPAEAVPSRAALFATFAATIVAAVAATTAVSLSQGSFDIPAELATRAGEVNGLSLPPEMQAEVDQAEYRVRLADNGLAYGLLGIVFGACFGFACGIAHRSFISGLLAAGIGILLGGALGAIGGVLGQLFDERFQVRESMDAFFPVVLMHVVSLSLVVSATGTAVAFGRRQSKQLLKLVAFATVATAIATALFLIIAPLASIERTNLPVPEGIVNQAIWISLLAVLLGFTFYRNRPK